MKFTVIIPTMWKANGYLTSMLDKYEQNPLIDEVLLINNAKHPIVGTISALYTKVKILGNGINTFVNPAWNFAVKEAKNENIIIANDDIEIASFDLVMGLLDKHLQEGQIIGFSQTSFDEIRKNGVLPTQGIVKATHYTLTFGFGVFMAVKKQSYLPIPEQMLIWYGDMYLYAQLEPYLIEGFAVDTPMSCTTRTMQLYGQKNVEKTYFEKNRTLFQKL